MLAARGNKAALNAPSYKADWEDKEKWYAANGYNERLLTSRDQPGGIGGIIYADEIRSTARTRMLTA